MLSPTKRSKALPGKKNGRQIIRPAQMGHEIQTCGDYEYCLGCGRNTKAKHSTSATKSFGEDNTVNRS
eukprot:4028401-Heterocapsa_arctica.AAC.1